MLRHWLFGRKDRPLRRRVRPTLSTERLEDRTLFAADALGNNLLLQEGRLVDLDTTVSDVALHSTGGVAVFQATDATSRLNRRNDLDILARRFDTDGQPAGDLIAVDQSVRGEHSKPSVATTENGQFTVVWSGLGAGDLQGIFARRFASDGTPAGGVFRVNAISQGFQFDPQVAMTPGGNGVVVWHGSGHEDADGIYLRRFDATGQPVGGDVLVNTTIAGEQHHPDVAIGATGDFVVTWSSRSFGAAGWDVFFQRFDAQGNRLGSETRANTETSGTQFDSQVSLSADGEFAIAWSSFGQDGDGWGVFAQRFDQLGAAVGGESRLNTNTAGHQRDVALVLAASGEMLATWSHGEPNGLGWEVHGKVLDTEMSTEAEEFTINSTSENANAGHQRFPAVAIDSEGTSIVAFQTSGTSGRTGLSVQRYQVDVEPPVNVAPRLVEVRDRRLRVGEKLDLEVTANDGNRRDDLTFSLDPDQSPSNATITRIDNTTARIEWVPGSEDRNQRITFRVFVDDNGTPMLGDAMIFFVDVENAPPIVDLNGSGEGIDRTAQLPRGQMSVALTDGQLTIIDADQTELESATVTINTPLDGASESLEVNTTGTHITAAYNNATGALLLTGSDTVAHYQQVLRTLTYRNAASEPAGGQRRIEVVANDGTARSAAADILLNVQGANNNPTLASLPNVTLLAGSPLAIPLDGMDIDGDKLTFSATVSNAQAVQTEIPTSNRSLRVHVAGFGDMVFQLYEDLAPRATNQIIQLAQAGFYDGIIFHRVVNGFVIQAGDPRGTGSGGSQRPNFDDQFNVRLQHNRSGILSMAKTTDDTNNSQFFITEAPARHLDFNHTIFGQMVEGESVREAISNVPVNSSSKPLTDVTISKAEVVEDQENGVLFLSAPANTTTTTPVTVTVTVSDSRGGTATRQFTVNVLPDTINGAPFLEDIPVIETPVDVPTTFRLVGRDVEEGDPVFYLDEDGLRQRGLFLPLASHPDLDYSVNETTGVVTVEPKNGLTGTFRFTVAAVSSLTGLNANSPIDYQLVTIRIAGPPDIT